MGWEYSGYISFGENMWKVKKFKKKNSHSRYNNFTYKPIRLPQTFLKLLIPIFLSVNGFCFSNTKICLHNVTNIYNSPLKSSCKVYFKKKKMGYAHYQNQLFPVVKCNITWYRFHTQKYLGFIILHKKHMLI